MLQLLLKTKLIKPLHILSRYQYQLSTNKPKQHLNFMQSLQSSNTMQTMYEVIKTKLQKKQGLQFDELMLAIEHLNKFKNTSALEWQSDLFNKCCILLERGIGQNQQIKITLSQTLMLRDIVYKCKTNEQWQIVDNNIPLLFKTFQKNYRQYFKQGEFQPSSTATSVEDQLKNYICYYSPFSYLDFRLSKSLSQKIISSLEKLGQSEILALNNEVMIEFLRTQSQKYELNVSQRNLSDAILGVFKVKNDKDKLSDLQHIKIYLCINASIIKVKSRNAKIFKMANHLKITKLLSPSNIPDISHQCLLYFLKYSQPHNNIHHRTPFLSLLNAFLKAHSIQKPNYLLFFKVLECANYKRENIREYIKKENILKIKGVLSAYLHNREPICNSSKTSEDCLKEFYGLLQGSIADEIFVQLMPQIEKNKMLIRDHSVAYNLATKGAFSENYVPLLLKMNPLQKNFQKSEYQVSQKVLAIQKSIAIKLYYEHYNQKTKRSSQQQDIMQKLATKVKQIQNLVTQLQNYDKFINFTYGLSEKNKLMENFMICYGGCFWNKLVNNNASFQAKQSILSVLEFGVVACSMEQMLQMCKKLKNKIKEKQFSKIIWHNCNNELSDKSIENIFCILHQFIGFIKNPSISEVLMNQIIVFLSNPRIIDKFVEINSEWLMDIFRAFIQTAYSNEHLNKKLQSLFLLLNSCQYSKLEYNLKYLRLLKYMTQEKIYMLTNTQLLKQLIWQGIQYNFFNQLSLQKIVKMKFQMHSEYYSLMFKAIVEWMLKGKWDPAWLKIDIKNYYNVVFLFGGIQKNELMKFQKGFNRAISTDLNAANIKNLETSVVIFSLPVLPDNYQLNFLIPQLQVLSRHNLCLLYTRLPLTLQSLLKICKRTPLPQQIPSNNTKHLENVTNFHQIASDWILRILEQLKNKQSQVYQISSIEKRMSQIQYQILLNLLQFCNFYSIVDLEFFSILMKVFAYPNGYLKFTNSVEKTLTIFGQLSWLVIIEDPQIFKSINKIQSKFPSQVSNFYLYELLLLAQQSENPQQFIKKIIQKNSKISGLIFSYLKHKYPTLTPLTQILQLTNKTQIGKNQSAFNQLLNLINRQHIVVKFIKFEGDDQILQVVTKQKQTKYYVAVNDLGRNVSVSVMYWIRKIVAFLQQANIDQVFVFSELEINKFLNKHKRPQKINISEFEKLCSQKYKFI